MFNDHVSGVRQARAASGHSRSEQRSILLAKDQVRSFLTSRNFTTGLWISLATHLAVIIVTLGGLESNRIEFWVLTLIDTVLLALILTPLVAIVRGELAWYDPIAILSGVYLLMAGFFYLAFMLDPTYTFYRVASFGQLGSILPNVSDFLWLVSQAELLLLVFLLIVLFTNRHPLTFRSYTPSPSESSAALITFLVCIILGMFGWLIYWSQRSYFESATVALGANSVKILESGSARYILLSTLGLTSITLGIAGGYGFVSRDSRRVRAVLLIIMIAITALADLPSGSRTGILAGVVLLIYMARLFGFRVGRSVWVIGGLVSIGLLLAVTFVRGNPFISDDPNQVLSQIVTGEAGITYLTNLDSPVSVLFVADRVSAVTVVLQHFANGGEYLYGQTMIAGVLNLAGDFANRLGYDNVFARTPLLWASDYILVWFFGFVAPIGTLPPSIPGEFYMQGGWFAFFPLSVLFGLLVKWMRVKLANSNSLLARWFLGVLLFRIVIVITVEVSGLVSTLFLFMLPIILAYWLVLTFFPKHSDGLA